MYSCKKRYHLEEELSDANEKAGLAQEEVSLYKVKNSKLSEQNVKVMASLTNSKSTQDALGKQLGEAIALGSYEVNPVIPGVLKSNEIPGGGGSRSPPRKNNEGVLLGPYHQKTFLKWTNFRLI